MVPKRTLSAGWVECSECHPSRTILSSNTSGGLVMRNEINRPPGQKIAAQHWCRSIVDDTRYAHD